MAFQHEFITYALAGVGVAIALIASRRQAVARFAPAAYVCAGLVGVASLFNFGWLHHYNDLGFVNRWEQFHYQLGSKYFPELRYDGLYAASLAAQRQSAPRSPTGTAVRDLTINQIRTLESHEPIEREVRGRFADIAGASS